MKIQNYKEKIVDKIFDYKSTIIFTFLAGMVAHGYMFTNKIANHDDIGQLFSLGATISSGRWGLWLLDLLPNYSMPWLNGIVSLILMIVSVCCILEIFEIRDGLMQCLLGGLIISFPSLTGTFCFMFTSCAYTFSFFLAVMSVYWIKKNRMVYGCVCLVLSLSIYQAYIAVSASLLLIIIVKSLLSESDEPINKLFCRAIKYILLLGISLGVYYVIARIIMQFVNIGFNEYAQRSFSDSMGIRTLVRRIYVALVNFFYLFSKRNWGIVNTSLSLIMHVVLFFCGIIFLIKRVIHNECKKKFFLLVCIALLPLSINCIYLMVEEESVHTLVLYSFSTLYILVVIIIEQIKIKERYEKVLKSTVLLVLSIIIVNNTWIANKVYLEMQLAYENAFSFYTSVITQVKQTEGFDEDCKLALVGEAHELVYSFDDSLNDMIRGADKDIINVYSRNDYIRYYIGFDVSFASEEEVEGLKETTAYKEMNTYPYYGSVKKIGQFIVVKFE